VGGWLVLVASMSVSQASLALSLQELSTHARGRVAHMSVRDEQGEEDSSGSGFVISRDGRIATNYHVIDGATNMVAVFPDDQEAKVTGVWAADKLVDIAVLQLEPGQYEPLELAAEPAKEGEAVVVIGSPLGLSNSISSGIVSAVRDGGLDRRGDPEREQVASWSLQITAAISPGSSGSPILRDNGQVVGVAVGTMLGLDGMHFGIAVEKLRRIAAAASPRPRPLAAATGVRSVRTNLTISGGLFAAVVAVWVAVSKMQGRPRTKR
jgi:S1-C subfamily serine protease